VIRKRIPPTLNYTLGNTLLNVVNSYSYLGVTVSSDLRWHEHVNNVSAKATKTLNFIRHNVYCFPPDTKAIPAYISLVHPHLECAAAAWDPYLVVIEKQLEKVQRRSACFVKRHYRSTTSMSSLISQLGWQTLSDHWKNSRLSPIYKTVWLVFPPHLFVVLPSPLVQLMAKHFVSCPLESILTSTPSILVPLLTGMPSRHL